MYMYIYIFICIYYIIYICVCDCVRVSMCVQVNIVPVCEPLSVLHRTRSHVTLSSYM